MWRYAFGFANCLGYCLLLVIPTTSFLFFGSRLTPVGDLSVSECGSKFICGVSFRYVGERGCGWLAVVVVVLHWVFPVCPPAGKGAHCNERSNFIDFAKSFLFRYDVSGDWCFCCFTGFFLIFLDLFSTHISPLIFPVIRVSPLFSLLDFPFFPFSLLIVIFIFIVSMLARGYI